MPTWLIIVLGVLVGVGVGLSGLRDTMFILGDMDRLRKQREDRERESGPN